MTTEQPTPFFLIVADRDQGFFSVEGPMTDDRPWQNAARHAREQFRRRVVCGPAGPDRNARAIEFQRTGNLPEFRRGASSGHANE